MKNLSLNKKNYNLNIFFYEFIYQYNMAPHLVIYTILKILVE